MEAKITVLVLLTASLFFFIARKCDKDRATFFENQSKDRYYQIQRLQFKVKNLKAKPGSLCFFGDSITRLWPTGRDFPGSYNRGIDSETTSRMLSRFQEDVIDLHPRGVIILGGTNDVGTHVDFWETLINLCAMCFQGERNGIKVYLGTIPPIDGKCQNHLNAWIRESGYRVIDFDKALANHPEYFLDRAHPNAAGYAVMSELTRKAILHEP